MYTVIFEVEINRTKQEKYLEIAGELKKQLINMDGFISIERFSSFQNNNKILSLSFWQDEKSIKAWKQNFDHMNAQKKGRDSLFSDYRIRIAKIEKDYTMESSSFQ